MDTGFFRLDGDKPFYTQIYTSIKRAIEEGQLEAHQRLPSIRSLADGLSVSKITVERAYEQLYDEGYIIKNPNARYTVAEFNLPRGVPSHPNTIPLPKKDRTPLFDFSSGHMDREGFDFAIWRKYLNRTFDDKLPLMEYGNIYGEKNLRQEICSYLFQSRGVSTQPEQIIIGANAQVLLSLLCQLLDKEKDQIAFEDPGFAYGRQIFSNYGFPIHPMSMGTQGFDIQGLAHCKANLCYVSPSHQFPTGTVMSVVQRSRLLNWADAPNNLIIEDDYDSEFRYYGNPIPALKGLDKYEKVVYLGSFSKIIPPSIRVSYMLLPLPLLQKLFTQNTPYSQTASTIDQLTLAAYLADGELERQVRRLRKRYQEKREHCIALLHAIFHGKATLFDNKSGLFVVMQLHNTCSGQELARRALCVGCKVAPITDFAVTPTHDSRILLYFSGIPSESMGEGLQRLHDAWFPPS